MPDLRLKKTEFWRMKEFAKDKMRLEHIAEAIERLQTHAGNLSKAELRKDVLRYYGIVRNRLSVLSIPLIGNTGNPSLKNIFDMPLLATNKSMKHSGGVA